MVMGSDKEPANRVGLPKLLNSTQVARRWASIRRR